MQSDDTLEQMADELSAILDHHFGAKFREDWVNFVADLPDAMTFNELSELLSASNEEQRARILLALYDRLELPLPEEGFIPNSIKLMTMHGAKGLSARAVFIPGLEDEIFPGDRRRPFAGLVLEGARLLYVSITRARVACFLSYANRRYVNGQNVSMHPSRYALHTGGAFAASDGGITPEEAGDIQLASSHL